MILYVTLFSSTQLIKLSQLNTFSRFCWKRNFFEATKLHSVSMWHITWLFLFTLSIPLNQLSVFITKLIILQFYKLHTQ